MIPHNKQGNAPSTAKKDSPLGQNASSLQAALRQAVPTPAQAAAAQSTPAKPAAAPQAPEKTPAKAAATKTASKAAAQKSQPAKKAAAAPAKKAAAPAPKATVAPKAAPAAAPSAKANNNFRDVNFDAFAVHNDITLKTVESINQQVASFNNNLIANNTKLSKDFFSCKTLQDLAEFQAKIFQINSEIIIDNASTITESLINYFEQSITPIEQTFKSFTQKK